MSVKEPPHDQRAEQAVLGSVLINPASLDDAVEIVGPDADAFSDKRHQLIWAAYLALARRRLPIEPISVASALGSHKEAAGGNVYLGELIYAVPTSANVQFYAQRVREKHLARQLYETCRHIAHMATDPDADVIDALDTAEQKLLAISTSRDSRGVVPVADVLPKVLKELERLANNDVKPGISTGLSSVDNTLGGWQDGDMIVLAARPSVGKTALALNIAWAAAARQQIPALLFSLEMSKEQIVQRLVCIDQGASMERLRTGFLVGQEMVKVSDAVDGLRECPLYIDDSPGLNTWELRSKARRFVQRHGGNALILIDYLQLLRTSDTGGRRDKRYIEVGEISRAIKGLARELNVPIVTCCQLSRDAENERNPYNQLRYLREAGDIEQDADLVLILSKLEGDPLANYTKRHGEPHDPKAIMVLTCAKHRNGPTKQWYLFFDRDRQRIDPLSTKKDMLGPSSAPQPSPTAHRPVQPKDPAKRAQFYSKQTTEVRTTSDLSTIWDSEEEENLI